MTRIYHGWFVLAGAFIANLSFGPFLSFGVFYTPLLLEFGWSNAQTGSIVALALVMYSVSSIVMGSLSDKIGARKVFALNSLLIGVGLGMAANSNSIWELYLFYSVLGGTAWGSAGTVPLSLAVKWFTRKRALATSIVVIGSGTSTLIFPTLSAHLMNIGGWRGALLTISFIFAGLLLLAAVMVKQRPESIDARWKLEEDHEPWTLRESMKTKAFWSLFSLVLLPSLALIAILVYMPPLSIARGIDPFLAAGAISTVGGTSIFGRLASPVLVRMMGGARSLSFAMGVMSLSTLLVVIQFDLFTLYTFSLFYGFAYGVWIADSPTVAGEFFGRANYGAIWGVINAAGGVGGLIGPLIAGLILDMGGFDLQVLILVTVVLSSATIMSLFLEKPLRSRAISK